MKLTPGNVDLLGMLAMAGVVSAGLLLVVLPLTLPSGADPVGTAEPAGRAGAGVTTTTEAEPDDEVRKVRTPSTGPTEQRTERPDRPDRPARPERPALPGRPEQPGQEDAGALAGAPLPDLPPVAPPQPVPVSTEFVVSSFNVLGSSHTAGPDGRKGFGPGTTRARYAAQLLAQHQVDVVGFQELQPDQMRVLQAATDGRYAIYPGMAKGREAGVNSVAWLQSEWTAEDAQTVTMPYFSGNPRELPLVRLRHNSTGLEMWIANFHNPADAHGPAQRWRDEATRRQVALVNDLVAQTALPVLFTGDFNDREEYFCPLVGGTPMVASNGGSADGACDPPSPMHVDWIFATPEISWLGHLADRSALVQRTTDHPMIVARARLDGLLTPDGGVDPQTVEETRRALERVQE